MLPIIFTFAAWATHISLIIYYLVISYRTNRVFQGNGWLEVWISLVGLILDTQSFYCIFKSFRSPLRFPSFWIGYSIVMASLSIVIMAGYASQQLISGAFIPITWLPPTISMSIQAIMIVKKKKNISDTSMSSVKTTIYAIRSYTLWFLGILTTFIAFSLAILLSIQSVRTAIQNRVYPPAGNITSISYELPDSDIAIDTYLHCVGPNNDQPIFVIHTALAAPAEIYQSLQDEMSKQSRRSCVYDRPGRGWTDQGFVPMSKYSIVGALDSLLTERNETAPYIMVGHLAGGEFAQMYAYRYPDKIAGVALIDSFPEAIKLYERAHNVSYSQVKYEVENTLQSGRVAAPLAVFNLQPHYLTDDFHPLELYLPSQFDLLLHDASAPSFLSGNNLFWQGVLFEYQGCPLCEDDSLTQIAGDSTLSELEDLEWPSKWPSFEDEETLVLIITTEKLVNQSCNNFPSDSQECEKIQTENSIFRTQVELYEETLSRNVTVLTCEDCDFNLPWINPKYLVDQLLEKFES